MTQASVIAAETPDLVEDLLAELTTAAYRVALRHGIKSSFLDVELDLWRELRGVLGLHEET